MVENIFFFHFPCLMLTVKGSMEFESESDHRLYDCKEL